MTGAQQGTTYKSCVRLDARFGEAAPVDDATRLADVRLMRGNNSATAFSVWASPSQSFPAFWD